MEGIIGEGVGEGEEIGEVEGAKGADRHLKIGRSRKKRSFSKNSKKVDWILFDLYILYFR